MLNIQKRRLSLLEKSAARRSMNDDDQNGVETGRWSNEELAQKLSPFFSAQETRKNHSAALELMAVAFLTLPHNASAATINVSPGTDTIASALSGASSGDVLQLADGTYNEGHLVIDNNLAYGCMNNGWYDAWNGGTFSVSNQIVSDPLFVGPTTTFEGFMLGAGSPAIDAGIDVGLPYHGAAPDIGAIEFDISAPRSLRLVS